MPPSAPKTLGSDKKITLGFVFEKETSGTVRFREMGKKENFQVGTLYVKKTSLVEPYPATLKVTIEVGQE